MAAPPLLPFAQLDLPGRLGPGDGRYLIRPEGDEAAEPDVLVISTLGAPRAASRLRRGRSVAVDEAPSATPLPLTRATLIRPRPFAAEADAESWLRAVGADGDLWGRLAREAAGQLNRCLHAHRTAAGDPYVPDVDPGRAAAVRFGYGTGDEVADGRWRAARELSESDRRRLIRRDYEALRPQERVAAVLGGRERVGPHEDLIVRARGDYDAGRIDAAALGLNAALRGLGAAGVDVGAAAAAAAAADQAVIAGREPDRDAVGEALRSAEAAIRRRALE